MYQKIVSTFLILTLFIACSNEANQEKISQEEATEISKQDTLSEADVLKMMNATDVPALSYSGAVTRESSKEYFYESDSNKSLSFVLKTSHPDVTLQLYKEITKTVKVDSAKKAKIKDYLLLKDSIVCNDICKKPTKYRALVKFTALKTREDSTAMFSIDVMAH